MGHLLRYIIKIEMNHIKLFENFGEDLDPHQEALNIKEDILGERTPEELMGMTLKDAIETVETYGHSGEIAKEIAYLLWKECEGA